MFSTRTTLTSLLMAPVTLLAITLVPAAGAQASATVNAAVSRAAAPSRAAARTTQIRSAVPAQPGAADIRHVCGTAKPGFASCMSLVRTNVPGHKGLFPADAAPAGFGPSDLESAYDLPSATAGDGKTVTIVDAYDDPDAEADLQMYRAQYGLPVCDTANGCFEKVNQEGQQGDYPSPSASWAEEESLDVDMVSAICPNCHIILVEANSNADTDLYTAEDEAVALGAKYVSNSWAGDEYSGETQDDQYFNHPGVAITAAAGDSGYGVEYPAASQYVTAVGGTTLARDAGTARGWAESVWGSAAGGEGTGSGCSAYEAKPAWQHDTGCPDRTVADVSAVANPDTGVAFYDSYSESGWDVVGGTSVATPIIASTYALAGTPAASTYPSSYPYADPSALNDVTEGANGACTPAYLCTAGPGYDGPTGLGTPDGVTAFTPATYGTVSGTVTDAASGQPVSGATVTVDDISVTTNSSGGYTIAVPVGGYTVTAGDYGYATQSATGVQVTQGQTTTENFALVAAPMVMLSGTVTDGSGHGWPLYATVSVPGAPAPAYTDPVTGRYRLSVPDQATYTITVAAVGQGYQQAQQQVSIGTASQTQDFRLPVDASACDAAGYAFSYRGAIQNFNAAGTPAGWSVTDTAGTKTGWVFDDPVGTGNQTGGTGGFAAAEPGLHQTRENSELTSPVMNLAKDTSPVLQFDTAAQNFSSNGVAATNAADVSVNGGKTWAPVWDDHGASLSQDQVAVALPQAAGKSRVQVRFHFTGSRLAADGGVWWQVDDVFVGNRTCGLVPGGLVEGTVTDGITGHALDDATIVSASDPGESAATGPVSSKGFYQLFVSPSGAQPVTVAAPYYASVTESIDAAANKVTRADIALPAGRLAITPASLSATEAMGSARTEKATVTNTGTAPAIVQLNTQPGGFTLAGQPAAGHPQASPPAAGARLQLVRGHYSPLPAKTSAGKKAAAATGGAVADSAAAELGAGGPSWTTGADYPTAVEGNAVATDPGTGEVYSAGGYAGSGAISSAYSYDPYTQKWVRLPRLPVARQNAAAAFTGGRLYVAGGWNSAGMPESQLEVYDPAARTWSAGAREPAALAGSAVAVLNGDIYVVGGCTSSCGSTSVQVYDPSTGTWSSAAAYPEPVAYAACGTIGEDIYCAGGTSTGAGTTHGYAYDPTTNSWSSIPSLPIDLWGMGYSAADGQLLVSGGVTDAGGEVTNQGFAYTPGAGWSALPDSPDAVYRGGSSCGLYQVGGYNAGNTPVASTQVLPGYDDCTAGNGVSWLTASPATTMLAPGASTTITVTLNAGDTSVTQPGTYTASLAVVNSTPYQITGDPVQVGMTVTPPKSWGEITGTVTGQACDGTTTPLTGATVAVTGTAASWTLTTGLSGQYALWLDKSENPLTVIASASGWQPQTARARVAAGKSTAVNLSLNPGGGCPPQDASRHA